MKLINVRSPFVVEVNEAVSDGSKIEIYTCTTDTKEAARDWATGLVLSSGAYIYNAGRIYICTTGGTTSGSGPTHTSGTAASGTAQLMYYGVEKLLFSLSKNNPSLTQKSTSYNISSLIRDFIDNDFGYSNGFDFEELGNVAFVRVKRYKLTGSTYTLLDTEVYAGVNGYTYFENGANQYTNFTGLTEAVVFGEYNFKYLIRDNLTTYVNIFVKPGEYNYYNFVTNEDLYLYTPNTAILRVPIKAGVNRLYSTSGTLLDVKATTFNEAKYTPVVCRFLNSRGGWEFLMFFKAKIESIAVKKTEYKVLPSAINYDYKKGQTNVFNTNGQRSLKLNTGFVDEEFKQLIEGLLLSERVFLDGMPATVKTTGAELKTSLQNKMINYEMEFDYAFSIINNQL